MAKQKSTTRVGKRYRYSSFKDKIDDLRIEPLRNLQKRIEDDEIESSHFLVSFDQWKEKNLSAGFTRFSDEVEDLIQTLPQIIYHEEKILHTLLCYIEKHEETSLQPLLDLLAQFCHDIGPDFLNFYGKVLSSLIKLLDAAKELDSANIFEWGFNCLAYIFKYLSRYLSKDLIPTFDLLFPLLTHSKEYISRFSAEALSFLVRKASSQSLKSFITYAFGRLETESSDTFYDGLLTLFTESLLSTTDALHSKSKVIIRTLLDSIFDANKKILLVDLFSDIWINISNHASQENLVTVYSDITTQLYHLVSGGSLNEIVHILSALVFSESGRKVSSWTDIIEVISAVLSHEQIKEVNSQAIAFMFATVIRNCDVKNLTQCHKKFFDFFLKVQPRHFIDFFKSTLGMATERLLSFNGNKYLQQYINLHWKENKQKIALFLFDLKTNIQVSNKLSVSVPQDFAEEALLDLETFKEISNDESLAAIGWDIIILESSSLAEATSVSRTTCSLLLRLTQDPAPLSDFRKDIIGLLLQITMLQDSTESTNCLKVILNRQKELQSSLFFIKGFNHVLRKSQGLVSLEGVAEIEEVILILSDNLLLPESRIRDGTYDVIKTLLEMDRKRIPEILNSTQIIDQIPLTLQNARDITTRIRKVGEDYAKMDLDLLVDNILFKHMFGLLTVRFSPVWETLYEIIPKIYNKNQSLVWDLLLRTLTYSDKISPLDYLSSSEKFSEENQFWNSSISRFMDTINYFTNNWEFCQNAMANFLDIMKERRGNSEVSAQLRSQVLKLMLLIPDLAERHSRDIVPFIFNELEAEEIFQKDEINIATKSAASWTEADRNSLLRLIGKFKNIKAIYKADEVQERLLVLLASRNTEVQKLALDGLLAYHDTILTRYKQNLKNLLDDTLFNDEITNMLTNADSSCIQTQDKGKLMVYVVRIFFGRAQTPSTSGIKKSRKHAVIASLPSFGSDYISEFFRLGYDKINYVSFFESSHSIDSSEFSLINIRRMLGFVNVLNSSLAVLGTQYTNVVLTAVKPLLYCIAMSYHELDKRDEEVHLGKMVINLRQQSMKCLNIIFENCDDPSKLLEYITDIYSIVFQPRIAKFETENLQQVSSIMKLIVLWTTNTSFYPFLYQGDYSCAIAIMKVLANDHAKDVVVGTILEAANNIVVSPTEDTSYVGLITIIGASCLQHLPNLLKKLSNPAYVSLATDLLLHLTQMGYIQDTDTKNCLIMSLTPIIEGGFKGTNKKEIVKMLKTLSMLLENYACNWDQIENLYKAVSALYRTFAERDIREELNRVVRSMAKSFPFLTRVSQLLDNLNSYSSKRIQEYDFPRMLSAFKVFSEKDFLDFSTVEWLPMISSCLFFINDKDEMSIRTNASHALCKLIDYANSGTSETDITERVSIIQERLLPYIRTGLRNKTEEIQTEYITVVAYIVANGKTFTELSDMQVLLFDGDEEANFFANVNHIQLHRRLRAIKRLRDIAKDLTGNSIAHYLLPIMEQYVFSREEKYRNIGNEALLTIGALSNYVTWNQYRALMRRYISLLKSKPDLMKESVNLIVQISGSLKFKMCTLKENPDSLEGLRKFPNRGEEPHKFIINDLLPTLSKILDTRDTETIVVRMPLAEALVNFVIGLKQEETISLLPGILTSLCQVLRSKSEELRDATRKSLAKIATNLGPLFLRFIIKELVAALKRGSQIHVLSYTVHNVLHTLGEVLNHGDMDDSTSMLVNIIMEDIFGSAGEEKESENYNTKVKEVKVSRSYDTAEMLASNISLPIFGTILQPVKALLQERVNLKSQNKLNELLRRYSLGLKRNSEASSIQMLTMCHEIYTQSKTEVKKKRKTETPDLSEKHDFFLVNLNAKNAKVQNETNLVNSTLQKFSLDLLHAILTKHKQLLDVAYLEGFVLLLRDSLDSNNEGVLSSAFKVLSLFVKLDFSEDSESVFKNYARRVLIIIKESPSTTSELCQLGLKFLSAIIRHKDIKLKDSALSYVLIRILPDLNEPNKQGLAFGFLKALVSKHIILPEIYDVLDSVKEIMITNHSREIRDVSRSVFYQFLMEYDQSKGRLERQFKFMVDNLQYPSPEGRQSVMELVNLIITKSNAALLAKLSSSFFVGLSNVAFNDDVVRCREMATILLGNLLKKLNESDLDTVHKYITAWLGQVDNSLFLNLGLRIFKIYVTSIGQGHDTTLDDLAILRVKAIISCTGSDSESDWELVYAALSFFSVYAQQSGDVYSSSFKSLWNDIVNCLLYPHQWVRQGAARLIYHMIDNMAQFSEPLNDAEIQTIASKIMRQLGAPGISEELSSISLKTLVKIAIYWKQNETKYQQQNPDKNLHNSHENAVEFMVAKAASIIRSEENPADSFMSKKTGIQLFTLLVQMLDTTMLGVLAEKMILPLFVYLEYDNGYLTDNQLELRSLSQECLQILETKISVADFTRAYANVKREVMERRRERRAKRAVLAVTNPETAAQRKLKKHTRSREKRKHERDENGYYQRKNKKKRV